MDTRQSKGCDMRQELGVSSIQEREGNETTLYGHKTK